ncbi:DUF1033 family protein [Psychrobacillus sp. MER TA 171]|uniref:DUF1033 family protein n=1 Tax=Psychrobacillus sp. MER TA 171 TaxID=2939577 RepID=UPI0025597F13|nr:DUF1033 family protein [Psychrobacillus sp. MER TA 171]
MYEVIYMKADYEPWWAFEGWEEFIMEKAEFEHEDQARSFLEKKLTELRGKFPKEEMRNNKYWAFWSVKEQCYCESCEDDLQIFHGIIFNIK